MAVVTLSLASFIFIDGYNVSVFPLLRACERVSLIDWAWFYVCTNTIASEWVRFLTAHQHIRLHSILCYSRWKIQDRIQIKNTDNTETEDSPDKNKLCKNTAKQSYRGLVAFYDTQPGNEVRLFYNAGKPTQGYNQKILYMQWLSRQDNNVQTQ